MKTATIEGNTVITNEALISKSVKDRFNEKATKLLTYLSVGIVVTSYPILFLFSVMNWTESNTYGTLVATTALVSVLMLVSYKLFGQKKQGKYLTVFLMYFFPVIINATLYSNSAWSVLFLYLVLSILYLSKKILLLSAAMGIINMAVIIYFDFTMVSDSVELSVMLIMYLFTAVAGYVVVSNGEKLISQIEKDSADSLSQSDHMKTIIEAAQYTIQQLRHSAQSLDKTSASIVQASDEVNRAIEDIASSTSSQAEDTENGAEHVNDLGKLLKEHSKHMTQLTNKTHEASSLRKSSMENLTSLTDNTNLSIDNVREIETMIQSTSVSVAKIEAASSEIANISEQTNLLALNASIEAARAGEEGRGFAVVAEEIRKLAEQSHQFNEEIVEVISNLTKQTKEAVGAVINLREITKEQQGSLNDTNNQFDSLSAAIVILESVISTVTDAGEKMEVKTDELIDIMQSLSAASEENASTTEEISASTGSTANDITLISNEIHDITLQVKELETVISD
ncbi:MAG: hypothetical protein JJU16_10050 [Alkalibacterium sp.]|nr:hypothetical protein [Alkalibacterium sp.]